MRAMTGYTAVSGALALYLLWTFATWFLEGRIETLLRPEATGDRAAYAIVVNLLIGTIIAVAVLRFLVREQGVNRTAAGFGTAVPSLLRLVLALMLGVALFALQEAPSHHPIVLANLYAQVLVVSTAEVLVCWSVIGGSVATLLRPCGKAVAWAGSAMASSLLFGLYHLAHSAPFNSLGMIALLTAVGLVTSAVFLVTQDTYATIAFHSVLALLGVSRAVAASGEVRGLAEPQAPLLLMAAAAVAVLALSDWLILRRSAPGLARTATRGG